MPATLLVWNLSKRLRIRELPFLLSFLLFFGHRLVYQLLLLSILWICTSLCHAVSLVYLNVSRLL